MDLLAVCEPGQEAASALLPLIASALTEAMADNQPANNVNSGTIDGAPCSARDGPPALVAAATCSQRPTAFHGTRAPPISIPDYVTRIARHSRVSPLCFVAAIHYISLATQADPNLSVCALTVHRLLLGGVLLACKLYDDDVFNNTFFAQIGGIPLKELNALEVDLFLRLEGRLHMDAEQLAQVVQDLAAGSWTMQRQRQAAPVQDSAAGGDALLAAGSAVCDTGRDAAADTAAEHGAASCQPVAVAVGVSTDGVADAAADAGGGRGTGGAQAQEQQHRQRRLQQRGQREQSQAAEAH